MSPTLFAHRTCGLRTLAAGRAAKGPTPGGSTEAAAGRAEGQAGSREYDPHVCQWHSQGKAPGI